MSHPEPPIESETDPDVEGGVACRREHAACWIIIDDTGEAGLRWTAMPFLPVSSAELAARGTPLPDSIIVTGDAYVDHPSFGSFGAALIGRLLEAEGYSVGIIARPDPDEVISVFIALCAAVILDSASLPCTRPAVLDPEPACAA
jgi:hypothetical protein